MLNPELEILKAPGVEQGHENTPAESVWNLDAPMIRWPDLTLFWGDFDLTIQGPFSILKIATKQLIRSRRKPRKFRPGFPGAV